MLDSREFIVTILVTNSLEVHPLMLKSSASNRRLDQ